MRCLLGELRFSLLKLTVALDVSERVNNALDACEDERSRARVLDAPAHRWRDANDVALCKAKNVVVQLDLAFAAEADVDLLVGLVGVEERISLSRLEDVHRDLAARSFRCLLQEDLAILELVEIAHLPNVDRCVPGLVRDSLDAHDESDVMSDLVKC